MWNTILIITAIIIALPFITALFVKKEYAVEREIMIYKPKHEVFDYIKHIKNQDDYSKWNQNDLNMKKEFRGVDGTPGFVYAWSGNKKAGEGEQEIISIMEGERLNTELRFIRPWKSTGHSYIITEAADEHNTKVKWGLYGESKYPGNVMNLFIGSMLGNDLDTNLNNLKQTLEK